MHLFSIFAQNPLPNSTFLSCQAQIMQIYPTELPVVIYLEIFYTKLIAVPFPEGNIFSLQQTKGFIFMKFYLAPMEGITTPVYRNALYRHYGGADRYYTPFLANLSFNHKELREILPENNKGLSVIPQILTNRAETFLTITKNLQAYGYKEANLNLGCPSATVTAKKRGAGFLSVPEQLDAFLEEIFTGCPLQISIKTRLGIASAHEWPILLAIYKKYPLKELIVHPRYQKDFYNGRPHMEAFQMAADALSDSGIPLCYNGDIASPAQYQRLLVQNPSTEAVMIGRGILADPSLFQTLRHGKPALPPDERIPVFGRFHDDILEGYQNYMSGDQPVLFKMKELWSYMGQYVQVSDAMLKKIRKAKRISEYRGTVEAILEKAALS